VNTLLGSDVFDAWLVALQDRRGKARIINSIRRAELGNFGDTKPVGGGVYKMRVHTGPGYRLY
jgi:putative addiction module killer protein